MNISDVKGGVLVRVVEDLEQSKLKMVVLFLGSSGTMTTGCMLVFDGVKGYQIFEERVVGASMILSLSERQTTEHGSLVRIDTNRGYRVFHCASASVCDPKFEA